MREKIEELIKLKHTNDTEYRKKLQEFVENLDDLNLDNLIDKEVSDEENIKKILELLETK